ncbi:MAG TPA: hypothetical protein VMF14_12185 [Solirubrobacteraceae bacterium]|nr:hypothetical protein [Solirubrobacteraceae bacterium]
MTAERPLRIAFVGQGVYFEHSALARPTADLDPTFIDFRAGAPAGPLLARLLELDPDVILVFRPEIIPAGMFAGLRAVTIGYLTEPLPRNGAKAHSDLTARLGWLQAVDAGNFDRIVSFDPLIAETASTILPVWRSLPIPVGDEMFMDVHERAHPPRMLFVGRSTAHREELLGPVKRRHPIVHIGHGLFGSRLDRFLRAADVQLNLHNHPYPTFENRVCTALAAGHLVISETLSPDHGLQAGRHLLQADTPEALVGLADELAGDPDAHLDVQRAGRAEAERFRASAVYPQLIRDALDDVARHGGRPRP